jgi:hypothetical protein
MIVKKGLNSLNFLVRFYYYLLTDLCKMEGQPNNWTTTEVCNWLETVNFGSYKDKFIGEDF